MSSREDESEVQFEEEVEPAITLSPYEQGLCIFEGEWHGQELTGFNAVTIGLNGQVQGDLNWKSAREQAQWAIEKGYGILWDMQLGLFSGLKRPLMNQTQFLSLSLSLQHFRDTLWKEFEVETVGLSLFRGSADFSRDFQWDEHQEQHFKEWRQENHLTNDQAVRSFCRNVSLEYLSLLTTSLPASLPVFLFLDASWMVNSLLEQIHHFNLDRFDRFHFAVRKHSLPLGVIGWGEPSPFGYSGRTSASLPIAPLAVVGVCIPPSSAFFSGCYQGLEEGIRILQERSIPYKLIAESQLTSQWDGLDYLLYTPSGLTLEGKRKLQGFCAAGGVAVSTGELLGLPDEISVSVWLSTLSII